LTEALPCKAVLAVVAYHSGIPGIHGGFVGVDVFFVISGFLITGLLMNDLEQHGRIDFLKFYARRVRRLMPTLLLVVLATVVAASCLLSAAFGEVQGVTRSAIATLLMFSNLHFLHDFHDYFGNRAEFQPLLHTWSLSVEEQFYLGWPAAMAIIWIAWARFGMPRRRLASARGLLALASAAFAIATAVWHNTWTFFLTPARGWELGLGGLVAVGLPMAHRIPRMLAASLALAGLVLIATGVALIVPGGLFPMPAALIPVLGACLVIAGNAGCPGGPAGRLLSTPAMVAIGLVSYEWYLWHWLVLSISRILTLGEPNLIRDTLLSLGTLALSFATVRYYANPLRFEIAPRATSTRVVACGGAATLVAVAIALAAGHLADVYPKTDRDLALLQAKKDFPADRGRCHLDLIPGSVGPCLAPGATPRILLWGDSMADRWAPAIQDWTNAHESSVAIERLTKDACPPLIGALPTQPRTGSWTPYVACRSFNDAVAGRLAVADAAGHSGVVLSAAWWPRATDSDLTRIGATERRLSFDVSARDTEQSWLRSSASHDRRCAR